MTTTIALIEDDEAILHSLGMLLENRGMSVQTYHLPSFSLNNSATMLQAASFRISGCREFPDWNFSKN